MADRALFSPFALGALTLKNRLVMAPMTRCRAVGNVPGEDMAEYYAKRADAGLLITEGTSPSPNGLGYARIPGLYSPAQLAGWKRVAEAVHARDGRIFVQLMHCGRIGHPLNLPKGASLLAPSAIAAQGQMYTEQAGMQAHPVPKAMSAAELRAAQDEFIQAAKNAIAVGLDGVELHAANGYLLDQFLNPAANRRTDAYGGSAKNRNRFVVELAAAVATAIGPDKVGVRLSPYGAFNDVGAFDGLEDQYEALAGELGALKLAYLHLVDHSAQGAPAVPDAIKTKIRDAFGGPIILAGGFDGALADQALLEGKGSLIAFGRPFIANPDLPLRLKKGLALNIPDPTTFYAPGPQGYLDYPLASE